MHRFHLVLPLLLCACSPPPEPSAGSSQGIVALTTLESVVHSYSGYDKDHDGTPEIQQLAMAPFDQPVTSPRTGSVLVLVESRLFDSTLAPELVARLTRWRDDLIHEGYNPRFVIAESYSGPLQQDGFSLLALRDFVKAAAHTLPTPKGVVLVGSFPEATLILTWMKKMPNGSIKGTSYPYILQKQVDRINPRADVVLGDLDGNWEAIYRRGAVTMSNWKLLPDPLPVKWPLDGQVLSGTTFEYTQLSWSDFFDLHEENSITSFSGEGPLRLSASVGSLARRDTEVSDADKLSTNPVAVPELAVSRIDARHVALQPSAPPDLFGRTPIGPDGEPRSLEYATDTNISWVRDPALEAQLLIDYFDRNHAFRDPAAPRPPKRVSAIRQAGSGLTSPGDMNTFMAKAGDGFDPAIATDNATLEDYISWLEQPALYRGVASHSNLVHSLFPTPADPTAFQNVIGGPPWAWRKTQALGHIFLTPSLQPMDYPFQFGAKQTGMGWEIDRAIWQNQLLDPGLGSIWFHQGCDLVIPENSENSPSAGETRVPFSNPSYGGKQNAESILFYLDAVAIFGRAKSFYDLPDGAPEHIKLDRRVGGGWVGMFLHDAVTADNDVLTRKKAYYWSLLGDLTLAPEPDTVAPTFDLIRVDHTHDYDSYKAVNDNPHADLAQVEYFLDQTPGVDGSETSLGKYPYPFKVYINKLIWPAGVYYLAARGCDEWGNCTITENKIPIDRDPPTGAFEHKMVPAGGHNRVEITQHGRDDGGLVRRGWTLSKNNVELASVDETLSPPVKQLDSTDTKDLPPGYGSGDYQLHARLEDIDGHVVEWDTTLTFDVDPPVIEAFHAVLGSAAGQRSVAVLFWVKDNQQVDEVDWWLSKDGVDVASHQHPFWPPTADTSSTTDVVPVAADTSPGLFHYKIKTWDDSGNIVNKEGDIVVYDETAPAPAGNFVETEPNDDWAHGNEVGTPSDVHLTGSFNPKWNPLSQQYVDIDNFTLTLPPGKTIAIDTGFTCPVAVLDYWATTSFNVYYSDNFYSLQPADGSNSTTYTNYDSDPTLISVSVTYRKSNNCGAYDLHVRIY